MPSLRAAPFGGMAIQGRTAVRYNGDQNEKPSLESEPMTADLYHPDFKTEPYWWDAAPPQSAPEDLPDSVDVAIVGSGYCGLLAAAELARNGVDVVVLEAGALGHGASTRSGGMVSSGQKLVVGGAIKGVAPELFNQMIEDSKESFAFLQTLVAEHKLDADLALTGRFFGAHIPAQYERLREIGRLLHAKTGVTVHEYPRARQHEVVGSSYFHGGIVIDDYGGLHPGKYHRSLIGLARNSGAALRSHAGVSAIQREGAGFLVHTARGIVAARHVVVTTNGYTGQATPELARRVVPVRSYQIATEPLDPALMQQLNPGHRMVTDTKRDLIYSRPSPDGTRMLLGTRPGVFDRTDGRAAPLLHRALRHYWPALREHRITHAWSGRVAMTFDKTAHMGIQDGVHFALGCNGNGVALMSYLGHRTARKILGQENRPCAFDQANFPTRPGYYGRPWFLPVLTSYYRARDGLERLTVRGR
jgi:glycine/D-amino acid oxidase-like deaminating enzyme